MALTLTPVPGNGVRVDLLCCKRSTVLRGFPLSTVRVAAATVADEHSCSGQ